MRGGAALRAGRRAAAGAAAGSVRHALTGCPKHGHPRRCISTPAPPGRARTSARLPHLLLTIFFFFLHASFFCSVLSFLRRGRRQRKLWAGRGAAGGCGAGLRSLRPLLLLPGSGLSTEQVGTGAPGGGRRAMAKGEPRTPRPMG